MPSRTQHNRPRRFISIVIMVIMICAGSFSPVAKASGPYDIDAAKALCDSLPLQDPEGIWIYPQDDVTVLILRKPSLSNSRLEEYSITVIESSDVKLHPGDEIGTLSGTPERKKFEISLFTERKNALLLKPRTVMATLSDEGETMVLKKEKSKFNLRLVFNPYSLLPKTWRFIRMNASANRGSETAPAIGMVKIYPSYDGNGSSRRQPRYL